MVKKRSNRVKEYVVFPSEGMQEGSEHDVLRAGKTARESLGKDKLRIICHNPEEINMSNKDLPIKAVLLDDFEHVSDRYNKETARKALFVSRNVFDLMVDDSFEAEIDDEIEVNIGTDPEFALREPKAAACTKASAVMNSKTHRFGADACLAELRPIHAISVKELILNTEASLKLGLKNNAKAYDWIGGILEPLKDEDRKLQIGGHVHIEYPKIKNFASFSLMNETLIRILDETMAVPMAFLEGTKGLQRRKLSYHGNPPYGNWGNFRLKPSEDNPDRIEWRTPSGIWLVTPAFANVFLELSKQIAEGVFRKYIELSRKEHGEIELNGKFKFLNLMKKEISRLTLSGGKDNYNKFIQALGEPDLSPTIQKHLNECIDSLRCAGRFLGIRSELVELFLEFCSKREDKMGFEQNLKKTWLERNKEVVVGTNILKSLSKETPDFKIIIR